MADVAANQESTPAPADPAKANGNGNGNGAREHVVHATLKKAKRAVMEEVEYIQKVKAIDPKFKIKSYLSEEALLEAVRPVMLKHGLLFRPDDKEHELIKNEIVETAGGGRMFHTIVRSWVRIEHVDSDGYEVFPMLGEASNPGDKSVVVALTYSYKAALRYYLNIVSGDDVEGQSVDLDGKGSGIPAKDPVQLFNDAAVAIKRATDINTLVGYRGWYQSAKSGFNKTEIDSLNKIAERVETELKKKGAATPSASPASAQTPIQSTSQQQSPQSEAPEDMI